MRLDQWDILAIQEHLKERGYDVATSGEVDLNTVRQYTDWAGINGMLAEWPSDREQIPSCIVLYSDSPEDDADENADDDTVAGDDDADDASTPPSDGATDDENAEDVASPTEAVKPAVIASVAIPDAPVSKKEAKRLAKIEKAAKTGGGVMTVDNNDLG